MFKTLDKLNQLKVKIQLPITFLMIVVWALLVIFNVKPTQIYTGHCYFHDYLGIFCPGCGGTRAFESMLYFHFLTSFIYNPAVIFTTAVLLFSSISYILYFITRGRILYFELDIRFPTSIVLVFIINFFIKNLLVLYFGFYVF